MIAYVLLRVYAVASVHQVWGDYPDSSTYRQVLGGRPYVIVSLLGNGLRPWTAPLFFALFPSDGWRVAAQLAVSIAAWLALAFTVFSELQRKVTRYLGLILLLVVSCSFLVMSWDLIILSESLALSMGAFLLASWIRFLSKPTYWNGASVAAFSVLWMFTRLQLVPLIAASAMCCFLFALSRRARGIKLMVAVLLVAVTLWGSYAGSRQIDAYAQRDGYNQTYFSENFALQLRFRILGDPSTLQWFRQHGMPEPQGLEPYVREGTIHDDDWPGFTDWYTRYRSNQDLVDWVNKEGSRVLIQYTLSHLPAVARSYADELPQILTPPEDAMEYSKPPRILPAPFESLLSPTSEGSQASPVPFLVIVCIAVGIVKRRLPANKGLFIAGLFLLIFSLGGAFVSWWGAPVSYLRHGVPFVTFMMLGPIFMLLAWLDESRVTGSVLVDDQQELPVGDSDVEPG